MSYIEIKEDTLNKLLEIGEKLSSKLLRLLTDFEMKKRNAWLDNQDVCLLLKKSKKQLFYLRTSGQLPYFKLDNKVYYREDDIKEYIEKRKNQ
ncbi:MAG: helix-turn-helix domain-containing protein [Dysgonomonas mossii]|uniref:helix-turn-helix domain-containing protein n=1 Tax=Dysgonomonas mossii TaxID=163665 RepID=UPI0039957725